MKKIIFLLISICLLSGCSKEVSAEQKQYNSLIEKLETVEVSTNNNPFDILLKTEVLVDEIRYTITINNVKEKLDNIYAIAYHNYPTSDVFPSIGIFDSKISLEPNGKDKGIVLVGYLPYHEEKVTYKLYVNYEMNGKQYETYWISTNND